MTGISQQVERFGRTRGCHRIALYNSQQDLEAVEII